MVGRSRKKKILFLTVGLLLLVLGIMAISGGAAILYYNAGTDSEGYAMSVVHEVRSSANAYVLWVAPWQGSSFSWVGESNIGACKWVASSVDGGPEVLMGWAWASDGAAYISNFRYETPDQVWNWYTEAYYAEIDVPSTKLVGQGVPSRVPSAETFWIDSAATSGTATIHWDPTWDKTAGMKMIILMNADGSSGVNVDLQLGFKVPILTWLPYVLIPLGILMCVGGGLLSRRRLHG